MSPDTPQASDTSELSRRNALQLSAVGLGALTGLPAEVDAAVDPDAFEEVTTVTLVDTALTHSLDADYAGNHVDQLPFTRVEESTSRLLIPVPRERQLRTLKRNDVVIHSRRHRAPPATLYGTGPAGSITIEVDRFSPKRTLPVEGTYRPPDVTTRPAEPAEAAEAADTAVVGAEGRERRVGPSERAAVTLDDRRIEVRKRYRDAISEERGRRPDADDVETVTATPEVRVKNYGSVTVLANRGGSR